MRGEEIFWIGRLKIRITNIKAFYVLFMFNWTAPSIKKTSSVINLYYNKIAGVNVEGEIYGNF
jgi:hypothetical protein